MENQKKGFWNERKDKLKEKFPSISDEDLDFHKNKEKEMIERLEYKLGKSKDELRKIINTLV
ncbi:MAG: general stress protein CsbD [Bacteroidales bacterium]